MAWIDRARAWTTERLGLLAVTALCLTAFGLVWELVTFTGVPVARDMQLFFVPLRKILWQSLQSGDLPLWSPLVGTGIPFFAGFQAGAFYPPHWIYGIAPYLPAFNALIVLHVVLGGVFTFALGRRLDLDVVASFVSAAAFMLGGYFISLTNLINALFAAAWAPGMALALLVCLDRSDVRSFLLVIGAFLMGFLAGAPQTFLLGALFAAGLASVRAGDSSPLRRVGRTTAVLAVAGVTVAGLAAVQILPTMELLSHSARGGGLVFEEAARFSLQPTRLVHLLLPPVYEDPVFQFGVKAQLTSEMPWLFSTYLGILVVPLCVVAWTTRERRGIPIFLTSTAVLGLILALGRHTPVFELLYRHVPGVSAFRYPEKFFYFTAISVALLSGHGWNALHRRSGRRWMSGALALAALSLLVLASGWEVADSQIPGWVTGVFPDAPLADHFGFAHGALSGMLWRRAGVATLALALVLLWRSDRLGDALFTLLFPLLLATDLVAAQRSLNPVVDPGFYTNEPAVMKVLPEKRLRRDFRYRASPFDEDVTRFHAVEGTSEETKKWLWQQTMQPDTPVLWGIQSHDSGDAIHLARALDETDLLEILSRERRLRLLKLGSVGVFYSLRSYEEVEGLTSTPLGGLPGSVYEFETPVPRAYLVSEGPFHPDSLKALNAMLRSGFDPREKVALLRDSTGGADAGGALPERGENPREAVVGDAGDASGGLGSWHTTSAGRARIVADRGEEVLVAVEPREAGYLVLTDTFYPGWRASVDGRERPIWRANYFYRAVRIEPGDRLVRFSYRSEPLHRGAWISVITLGLIFVGSVVAVTVFDA